MNRLEALRTLADMTLALAGASRLDELHGAVLDAIEHITRSGRASVLLFDPDGVMRFKASRGISTGYRAAVEGHTPWVPGQVDAVPLVIADVAQDPGLEPYLATITAEGIAAMAMIPLVAGGGVIGKFMVYFSTPQVLDPIELQLVQTVAAFAAFAIDRQRAVDQVESERGMFVGGPTVVFKWRNQPGWPVDYASPNLVAQFGHAPEDLIRGTTTYSSLVHPDDLDRVGREVEAAVASGQATFEQSYRLRRADGEYRTIYDFTVVGRRGSEVTDFRGYLLDVTDRDASAAALHEAETRLREVQRLESLGLLAGGIAHDFNNLLVGVLGNASLALDELGPDAPVRPLVAAIHTAAQHGADLTRQILAYSGKGKFVIGPVDLSQLVSATQPLLATVIPKTTTVHYDLSPALLRTEADATQIRQVLMNLLTNASDALEGRPGIVTVATRAETLGSDRPTGRDGELVAGEHVVLEVRDHGIGMSEDTVRRVFDPFFTTRPQGRGLGMAAVSGIVRGHRGAIKITSALGRGTTVRLYLPALREAAGVAGEPARPAVPESPGASQRPTSGAPSTVLVVDDEKLIRELAARILSRAGFVVVSVANGKEALDLLAAPNTVDVVLLDLTMPELSGEATLLRIHERWPQLPVVLSSGYSADSSSTTLTLLAAGFIQKPYFPEDLVQSLREAIASFAVS